MRYENNEHEPGFIMPDDSELTVCMDKCKHHYRETIYKVGEQETRQKCSNSPVVDPVTGFIETECDKINGGQCPNYEFNNGQKSRHVERPSKEIRKRDGDLNDDFLPRSYK